ncbi:MAG: response regulator transcription factor [Cyanobium sp.]|nr:response regulator transcription factor [Cyanobium sp.]
MSPAQRPLRLLLASCDSDPPSALSSAFRQEGFELAVCTGTESLQRQLATADEWDLLVVCGDATEPGILALCRLHRDRSRSVPLLLIGSATDTLQEAARVRALEAGADDVILEPFGLAECLARCRALARRRQQSGDPSTVLRCGPIEMVVEEHRVLRDGEDVALSPREFRLLRFLLEHQGRVWHREELLSRVWGELEALDLDPKTVDVHIHWLRLKLESDPARPDLLTTVRGRGYRLA